MNLSHSNQIVLRRIVPISIIFQSIMIFYSLVPSMIVAGLSFVIFIYYMIVLRQQMNLADSLLLVSILFIPTSTISILGTSYSSFPLTWHNLLIILLIVYIAAEGTTNRSYFLILFAFVTFGIVTSFPLPYIGNALKQVLIIALFICSFIIGSRFKNYSKGLLEIGWTVYFIGVISMALQVYLQQAYIMITGRIIGHYAAMGLNRIAYAGLMGDYSFAGLYLATGCLYAFIQYVHFKKWRFTTFVFLEIFLLVAILRVSSRTGLVALFGIIILYYLFSIRNVSMAHMIVLLIGIVTVPYVLSVLMEGRAGQNILDSSGRLENYVLSLQAFNNKFLIGYGLGLDNLYQRTGIRAPHNFFIQYLAQTGIIGTTIIVSGFLKFKQENLKCAGCYKWLFWMVMVGAMFIPDIVSSRFLYAIVILCMISASENNEELGGEI